MNERSRLTTVLALLGTVAVWLPVVLMLLTSATGSARAGFFRMDYLIPAELFPAIFVGGGLLVFAAIRARRRSRLIEGSFTAAVLALILSQAVATVSGLASGATPPAGPAWILTLLLLAIYDLSVVLTGTGGVLLVRDLSRQV
jgi:hypothetical protein